MWTAYLVFQDYVMLYTRTITHSLNKFIGEKWAYVCSWQCHVKFFSTVVFQLISPQIVPPTTFLLVTCSVVFHDFLFGSCTLSLYSPSHTYSPNFWKFWFTATLKHSHILCPQFFSIQYLPPSLHTHLTRGNTQSHSYTLSVKSEFHPHVRQT